MSLCGSLLISSFRCSFDLFLSLKLWERHFARSATDFSRNSGWENFRMCPSIFRSSGSFLTISGWIKSRNPPESDELESKESIFDMLLDSISFLLPIMLQQSLELERMLQQMVLGEFGALFFGGSNPFLGRIELILTVGPCIFEDWGIRVSVGSLVLLHGRRRSDFGITFRLTGGIYFGFDAMVGLGREIFGFSEAS